MRPVQRQQGQSYIWVVSTEEMVVRKKPIQVGSLAGSENIQVLEGLDGGETVVVAGMTKLEEGTKVYIWKPENY